jgi:predicted nuclease of predicted toxin-antitoxin system
VRSRHETTKLTFVVDRCLGRYEVVETLRASGLTVVALDDHFAQDCIDEQWIPAVAKQAWVILTKDKAVRRRAGELEALRSHRAAAFILTSGNATAKENAAVFLKARNKLLSLPTLYTRPLIATIGRGGKVSVIDGVRLGGVKRAH